MSLKKILYNLQNKSENDRKKIMWICVVCSMFIVVAIWIVTIKDKMQGDVVNDNSIKKTINSVINNSNIENNKTNLDSAIDNFMESFEKESINQKNNTSSESVLETQKETEEINEKGYKLPIE